MALSILSACQIEADGWKVEAFSIFCFFNGASVISPCENHFIICLNIFQFATTNCASHIIPSHKREKEQKLQAAFLIYLSFFFPRGIGRKA